MSTPSRVDINIVANANTAGLRDVTAAADQADASLKKLDGASATAATGSQKLGQAQDKAAGSGRNMGNAMLQGSRAIQDLQYGLPGVVNNLEGIASALGMGAGVAGVVTVLAVAFQQLGPVIAKALAELDVSKIKTDGIQSLKDQLSGVIEVKSAAEQSAEKLAAALEKSRAAFQAESDALSHNLDMLKQRNAAANQASQNKLEGDIADIKAQGLPKDQEAALIAAKKGAALDEQFVRGQNEANARIGAAEGQVQIEQKAREAAAKELASKEESLRRTIELRDLKEAEIAAQKKLQDAKDAEVVAAMAGAEGGGMEQMREAGAKRAAAQEELKKNQARQQALISQGGIGDVGTLMAEVAALRQAGADAEKRLADATRALAEAREKEAVEAQRRINEYQTGKERIAREANPGVYDPGNLAGGLPGPLQGAMPNTLPTTLPPGYVPGPVAPGSTLPGPLRGAAPSTLPQSAAGPADLGSAAQELRGATQNLDAAGAQQVAAAVREMVPAISQWLQAMKAMAQEFETLKSQVKNSR